MLSTTSVQLDTALTPPRAPRLSWRERLICVAAAIAVIPTSQLLHEVLNHGVIGCIFTGGRFAHVSSGTLSCDYPSLPSNSGRWTGASGATMDMIYALVSLVIIRVLPNKPSKPCLTFLLSLYAITEWSRSFGYFMASPLLGWGDFGDPTYGALAGLPDGAFYGIAAVLTAVGIVAYVAGIALCAALLVCFTATKPAVETTAEAETHVISKWPISREERSAEGCCTPAWWARRTRLCEMVFLFWVFGPILSNAVYSAVQGTVIAFLIIGVTGALSSIVFPLVPWYMTVPPIQKLAARMQRGLKHEQAIPLHTISTAATAALAAVALGLFALYCAFTPGVPYGWVDDLNATTGNATA